MKHKSCASYFYFVQVEFSMLPAKIQVTFFWWIKHCVDFEPITWNSPMSSSESCSPPPHTVRTSVLLITQLPLLYSNTIILDSTSAWWFEPPLPSAFEIHTPAPPSTARHSVLHQGLPLPPPPKKNMVNEIKDFSYRLAEALQQSYWSVINIWILWIQTVNMCTCVQHSSD